MGKTSSFYSELPPWAKGVVAIATIAIVAGVGIVIYKKISGGVELKKENKDSDIAVDAATQEANDLANAGVKPTQTSLVYKTTANIVAKLLDDCESFQSEYQVVEEVAKCVRNKMDWALLVKAFGTKNIANCGDKFNPFGKGTTYDLPTLLKDQLDTMNTSNTLSVNGYKKTFRFTDTKDILADYLKSKGVIL